MKVLIKSVGTPKGRPTWCPPPTNRWWLWRVGENYGLIFSR